MGYKVALDKCWEKLKASNEIKRYEVKFLGDTYNIDIVSNQIFSLSCNTPAPDYISVIILHYLIKRLNGMPRPKGKWISFQGLLGGQGYFDAFRKRAIDPIIRKYGDSPQTLIKCLERLPGERTEHGDAGVILEAFENIPVLITVWGKDDEFSADANIHFDESISKIFCTEDIAVLSDIVARQI